MTSPMSPTTEERAALRDGELEILGRIRSASNATFLCEASLGQHRVRCVYKPVAGEQPLWDFPDGTLAGRELSAYLISDALGWNLVPYTIIRDGPAGLGMVQLWVHQPGDNEAADDESSARPLVDLAPGSRIPVGYLPVMRAYSHADGPVTLVHADDARLRRLAIFDVITNNADRKGGHILHGTDGVVYGVDHGLCLHTHDKLRTVLWGWAGRPLHEPADATADETLQALSRLAAALNGPLGSSLQAHLTADEIAALRGRIDGLLANPMMPSPAGDRPIPWPLF